MKNIVVGFGLIILSLLILMKITEYTYFSGAISFNTLIITFSVIFFGLGIVLTKKYFSGKQNVSSPEKRIDSSKIEALGISKREYEVLQLIAKGHSNNEIAELLFVSENTIKTHISNLLLKLHAKRRTQAVKLATEQGIL